MLHWKNTSNLKKILSFFDILFLMKKIINIKNKILIDIVLFALFVVTVLIWGIFFNEEWFLYPVLVLIYIRIAMQIKRGEYCSARLGCRPKEYLMPFVFGIAFAIATWINLWIFGSYYDIPDWIKDPRFLPMLIISVFVQELIFRAYFISAFEKNLSKTMLIVISSIVFVAIHLFLPDISIFFVLLFTSWVFWSWLFIRYRNLYANVFSHFLINFWTPLILASI